MSLPVFVLFGPTGSGKTELLEKLFTGSSAPVPAELVSADSMQVYRGMDIGTAKPSPELRAKLPHHLIDIRNPNEPFNAGDFVRLADGACADIAARGKLPVVSGGTGFYLKNFILGLAEAPPSGPGVRAELRRELAEKGAAPLIAELAVRDPPSAARIHPNDTYRLLRALEVCRLSGRPLSSFAEHASAPARPDYRFLIAGLSRPREELYRRIEARCGEMFRAGLAAEVQALFRKGYTPADPGMRAIGYREFFVASAETEEGGTFPDLEPADSNISGVPPCGAYTVRAYPPNEAGAAPAQSWRLSSDLEGVQALIARNSRRYAKRQLTFFAAFSSALPGVIRLDAHEAPAKLLDLLAALVHT